nr:DUF58 domain-containing protein [Aliiroseovarius subalbicans]
MRGRAAGLAQPLPPLLAEAEHLAGGVLLGEHGRRRPGLGDAFWQYRPAMQGDTARAIDWRRSARSDQHFVQEKEWQAAQSVVFWVDRAASMHFASQGHPEKADRAALLALSLSVLLVRGGERIGLTDMANPPASGTLQLERVARHLETQSSADYGAPDTTMLPAHSRAVFLSDFMGDLAPLETALTTAADRGVKGALVHILDPIEEAFPFDGRVVFESMGGTLQHETRRAGDLRARYLDRLARRKAALEALTRTTGWRYHCHHTGTPAASALLWLYHAMERQR